jgi:acyl-[acyl-carrier-protein] desaturase
MDIIIKQKANPESTNASKIEVLTHLEPKVKELMASHIEKRKLWFSSDFLPADEKMNDDKMLVAGNLKERSEGLSDAVRVALALNLITEEGLPHFHRLISHHLGSDTFWAKWTNMWTAEEDRHGNVIRDYVRDSRIFNFREVELIQFYYQQAGFNPDWNNDPYKVFVYTTLQERATQISHKNTGRSASEEEPLLSGILNSVAADEAKHYTFYRNVFKEILDLDPEQALKSAAAIMPAIEMPGNSVENFKEMADIIRRKGIYGPWEYKSIVEEAIKFWNIEVIAGLSDIASKAQEAILAIPDRLKKIAEYLERRTVSKTFSFDFIYNRLLAFKS